MPTNTVELHRVIRAQPEDVYRAFLEADAMAKWLPPYGFTCKVHHMDAQVGGTFRMSFTNFGTGNGHSFGGDEQKCLAQLATLVWEGCIRTWPSAAVFDARPGAVSCLSRCVASRPLR